MVDRCESNIEKVMQGDRLISVSFLLCIRQTAVCSAAGGNKIYFVWADLRRKMTEYKSKICI